MLSVDIYGSLVYTPNAPLDTLIENFGKPQMEQVWRRKELPDFFDKINFDPNGNAVLTREQERFAAEEVRRCKEGHSEYKPMSRIYLLRA